MNVIVLDVHHPEDGRVNRHIKYVQSLDYNVIHINVNRYFSFLKPGIFSKYGELGYRITAGNHSQSLINRLLLLILFITPIIAIRIKNILNSLRLEFNENTIIHIHDYELLFTGFYLHYFFPAKVRIVYDRHELYETYKGKNKIFDKIPRIYERINSIWIDGIIGVSEDHLGSLKSLFKFSPITIVPNYSDACGYPLAELEKKISSMKKNKLKMIYFGSLDVTLDRDIYLILKVMDNVLQEKISSEAYIGGICSNSKLLSLLSAMTEKYPGRFHFIGYVPYNEVLSLSSQATIGFLCMKPEYWVLVSANKIYEYLHYGLIPVIKANIENHEIISQCSLIFSKSEKDETVIATVCNLIRNKERMKQMMLDSYEIGKQYTFDNVKIRYQSLYLDLFHNLK